MITIETDKVNAVDRLVEFTGIDKAEIRAIFEKVKENQRLLDGCVGPHDFNRLKDAMFSKFICSKCKGIVEATNASWYTRGLTHGQK